MTPTPIYYGDNGNHEFWEGEGTGQLILHHYGGKNWIAIDRDGGMGVLGGAPTPEDAARIIGGFLSTDRVWTGTERMRLVAVAK